MVALASPDPAGLVSPPTEPYNTAPRTPAADGRAIDRSSTTFLPYEPLSTSRFHRFRGELDRYRVRQPQLDVGTHEPARAVAASQCEALVARFRQCVGSHSHLERPPLRAEHAALTARQQEVEALELALEARLVAMSSERARLAREAARADAATRLLGRVHPPPRGVDVSGSVAPAPPAPPRTTAPDVLSRSKLAELDAIKRATGGLAPPDVPAFLDVRQLH